MLSFTSRFSTIKILYSPYFNLKHVFLYKTAPLPTNAAIWEAVRPTEFVVWLLAPAISKRWHNSAFPESAAKCNAVYPYSCFPELTSAPWNTHPQKFKSIQLIALRTVTLHSWHNGKTGTLRSKIEYSLIRQKSDVTKTVINQTTLCYCKEQKSMRCYTFTDVKIHIMILQVKIWYSLLISTKDSEEHE